MLSRGWSRCGPSGTSGARRRSRSRPRAAPGARRRRPRRGGGPAARTGEVPRRDAWRGAPAPSRSGLGLPQRAADETDGVDQWRAVLVQLLAQVAHVGLDHVRVALEVVAPDVVEDLGLREDEPRVLHEVAQQVELGRGEPKRLTGSPGL